MKWIKAVFIWITGVIAGMAGGQGKTGGKAPRRFGLPALAVFSGFSFGWDWRYLAFIGLVPVLIMGYGVNSKLMEVLGNDTIVRAVYAMLLSIPFVVFGLKRWMFAAVALIVAFQVRAGSLGNISWLGDILIEDIIRYGVLMALVLFNVMFRKKD